MRKSRRDFLEGMALMGVAAAMMAEDYATRRPRAGESGRG